jgi:hypothetical protein
MTITVNLPSATVEELKAEAAATGKDVEKLVREAVQMKLARRKQTFANVLKPIHDAVEQSGMSEEEAQTLVDKELEAVREERRSAQGRP